jgi:hypothetical protein
MVTPACTTAVDSTGDRTPTHGQIVTEPRSHGTVTDPIRTDCLVPGGEARPAQVDPQGHPTDPGHDSARVKRQRDGSRVGPLADRAGSSASAPLELRRPVRRCASAANSPPSRPAPVVNRSRRCSSMNLTIASTGGRAPPRRRPRPSSRCVRPPQLTVLRLRISEQVLDQTDRPVPHPLRILLRVPARRHPFAGSGPPPDPGRSILTIDAERPALPAAPSRSRIETSCPRRTTGAWTAGTHEPQGLSTR